MFVVIFEESGVGVFGRFDEFGKSVGGVDGVFVGNDSGGS